MLEDLENLENLEINSRNSGISGISKKTLLCDYDNENDSGVPMRADGGADGHGHGKQCGAGRRRD